MAKIYVSSTSEDLADHRAKVIEALRLAGHDLSVMENYVARDIYPLHHCIEDVAKCDIYVGLIAWRYGYRPEHADNPGAKSITELEYEAAGLKKMPRLMFILQNSAPWPEELRDSHTGEGEKGACIAGFRERVGKLMLASFFKEPQHLGVLVLAAVVHEIARRESARPSWTPVRGALLRYREHFDAASQRFQRLGDYKDLHDLLHRVQVDCYDEMMREQSRFPADEDSYETLDCTLSRLRQCIGEMREVVARSSEMQAHADCVEKLEAGAGHLQEALKQSDGAPLAAAIRVVRQVLYHRMTSICASLNGAARGLDIDNLTRTMIEAREAIASAPDVMHQMAEIQRAAEDFVKLSDDLRRHVADHQIWQAFDDALRLTESDIDREPELVNGDWKDVQAKVGSLYHDVVAHWADELRKAYLSVDLAIQENNSKKIGPSFRNYRRKAVSRFVVVDKDLKRVCDTLRTRRNPLADLLERELCKL